MGVPRPGKDRAICQRLWFAFWLVLPYIQWRETCGRARDPRPDNEHPVKVLAVIPARLGASRLPRKPLRLLGGQPLVVRVWQRVHEMEIAARCVVATDSAEVADAIRRADGDVVLTRADHRSGTDRVAEAATRAEFAGCDAVVNVQGDEPFVDAHAVSGALELVTSGRFAIGTAATAAAESILRESDVVKVVTGNAGQALYFSRAAIPHLRDDADAALREGRIRRHIGVYAYSRDALARWVALPPHPLELIERLEQLRPLAAGMAMGVADISDVDASQAGRGAGGIDTEEDLMRANELWSELMTENA